MSACVFCDLIQGDAFQIHLHVIPYFRGDGLGFRLGPGHRQPPGRALPPRVAAEFRHALEG